MSPKVGVLQSSVHGRGIIAASAIGFGETIIVWGGASYTDAGGAEEAREQNRLVMQWDEDVFSCELNDTTENEEPFLINHSCDPNSWMTGAFTICACRDIASGEEISIDYALWECDEDYVSSWLCCCGSGLCRGRVTGHDWKNTGLRQRYRGHFSPLIMKRIQRDERAKATMKSGNEVVPVDCRICTEILDYEKAYLDRNDDFSPESTELEKLGESLRCCPICGTLYYHDYCPPGPGNVGDFETLTRLRGIEEEIVRVILEGAPCGSDRADELWNAFSGREENAIFILIAAFEYIEHEREFGEILPILVELLEHSNEWARRVAAERLLAWSHSGLDVGPALAVIMAAILDPVARIRSACSEALGYYLPRVDRWDEIREVLRNKDSLVKRSILHGLWASAFNNLDISPIIPDLVVLLSENDDDVVRKTAIVFEDAQFPVSAVQPVVSLLVSSLKKSPSKLGSQISLTLGRMASRSVDISEAVPVLITLLAEKSYETRVHAANALGSAAKAGTDLSPFVESMLNVLNADPTSYSTLNVALLGALKTFALSDDSRRKIVMHAMKQLRVDRKPRFVADFLNDITGNRKRRAQG